MKAALAVALLGLLVPAVYSGTYGDRFMNQYRKIHSGGYFSREGVPYHAVETMVVEAPDHGHETTSEAYSYYVWLESVYGGITGDFSKVEKAWETLEQYAIPNQQSQPTNSFYQPSHPATYAAEWDEPSQYPSEMKTYVPVGQDPLSDELRNTYGTPDIYMMHWLQDVDNVYGFGNTNGVCEGGPQQSGPSFINTFQRGPMESVWRTIPQPTCDSFKYGGRNGFLDLFVKDNSYAKQWKYTVAPDAEARAIQAVYWAKKWASAKGSQGQISSVVEKATKMGDYLRYSMYDKYFKKIGNCIGESACPGGQGKDSAHYLLSWYFAWGGSLDTNGGWAWRISDSAAHFGYQNPLTAWVLSHDPDFRPRSPTAVEDWEKSLDRQLEFYEWLQTNQGAFAGGATNSVKGRYAEPDGSVRGNTFHGMFYDWEPVYHDPPSNRWYGMQAWSTDRLAQYYYATGDYRAKSLLDKWVHWVISNSQFNGNQYSLPATLEWSGAPPQVNVRISSYSQEVGTASATARALSYYAAKSGNSTAKDVAKKILDGLWNMQDDLGISNEEALDSYKQFNEPVYVPPGWTGTYPNGDTIQQGATFLSLRKSIFEKDPNFPKIRSYLNGGPVPKARIHRFWAQSDIAIAFGTYAILFNE